ncbi:3'-5' exonuclease [Clostridium chauvoei]|uniref:3'-5' exonuclease n=2 Tax=Clostridium chauvoei TaxID=46867 RepID=A0ABD4RFK0_9CLOT|nr:3'-5' exonuclease [Clostridium chauvoei]ATD54738.1 DNA polymerase III subunit epsilon [Clostridium chauvoei]ATD57581.1 DNA polymerase III subunit epsilon [Clostridium chauvoei]MBX7280038.1 3'-5' exonuclease [Clostridium chauvoei]MBX7282303.1 3'-5' exonuclease [Clostridium chauvoei]MBX7284929.1 3'-5' exonuclease [Clostridium chauvoei]
MKLLIFDTETTSVKPGHICQLSYILIDASKKPQTTIGKNFFFTVDEMDEGAEAVHGFSLEKLYELSNGQEFLEFVSEFMPDFFEADFIIGHNVQFDIKFLKHELQQLWEAGLIDTTWEPKNSFCTMGYYKNICKIPNPNGNIKNPKLSEVIDFLGITEDKIASKSNELFEGSGNYHDARFDTTATYLIIIEGMKKRLIPAGYFSNLLKNN